MEFYILFFAILITLTLISLVYKNFDYTCYIVSTFIAIFFIGGRLNVGADFIEYQHIYNYEEKINFDFLFEFFFKLFRWLGLSYPEASLSFFMLTLLFFHLAIKDNSCKTLSLFFFILYSIVSLTSTIRQGLSLPFYLLAFNYILNLRKYYFYSFIGTLFHVSSFIMLLIYPLKKIKISRPNFLFVILFSFLVGYFDLINVLIWFIDNTITFNNYHANKILTYSTRYNEPMSLISQLYRLGGVLFLFIFNNSLCKREDLNFCKNIYLMTFLFTLIFKDNGVLINRLSFSTNVSLLYIAFNYDYISKKKITKEIILLFFITYFSVNYFKFILTDLRYGIESAYLPYRNFIFDN
ncbi:EpsG family protein [Providencia alcalifaciens]|uniref:Wzy n=2 Tax=Providencia TaxID=586 RepID=A0A346CLQ2_9GAMM|nr:Wzy [Providencia alcalifaciens]